MIDHRLNDRLIDNSRLTYTCLHNEPQIQLEEASTHKSAKTHAGNVFVARDL